MSKTAVTFGCVPIFATARASRSNRFFNSGSSAICATMTLKATSRSRTVSWARYTWPIAPLPIGRTISYLPMRPVSSRGTGLSGLVGSGMVTRGRNPSQERGLDGMAARSVNC